MTLNFVCRAVWVLPQKGTAPEMSPTFKCIQEEINVRALLNNIPPVQYCMLCTNVVLFASYWCGDKHVVGSKPRPSIWHPRYLSDLMSWHEVKLINLVGLPSQWRITYAGQPDLKSQPQFQIFSWGNFFRGTTMAVIAGTESLEAPLDHPREQGEDRTNLIINYLPQVELHT